MARKDAVNILASLALAVRRDALTGFPLPVLQRRCRSQYSADLWVRVKLELTLVMRPIPDAGVLAPGCPVLGLLDLELGLLIRPSLLLGLLLGDNIQESNLERSVRARSRGSVSSDGRAGRLRGELELEDEEADSPMVIVRDTERRPGTSRRHERRINISNVSIE